MARTDEPEVKIYGHGLAAEFPDGPATAVVWDQGMWIVFRFAVGDLAAEGPLQEVWVQPDTQPLEPRALRKLMPRSTYYLRAVRAGMRLWGSDEGTPEERWQEVRETMRQLREAAGTGPGRGLSPGFYQRLGQLYAHLVEEGEPHPVKAISQMNDVKISTASKWLKEAEQRGYVERKKRGGTRAS